MESLNSSQKDLERISQDLLTLLYEAGSIPGISEETFKSWVKNCKDIRNRIQEDILSVAVVGPIKSGKSTFTNYLFHGDYLKRRAGVTTSIVTKIRKGEALKAKLFLKSWDEVNTDMMQAMVLMPFLKYSSRSGSFDIRLPEDRQNLQAAVDSLNDTLLISNGTRNSQAVLLSSYLNGYNAMQETICMDESVIEFNENRFGEHKNIVSDDAFSVYLKDIRLEIDTGFIDNNIEIADCQGSDSPNPLHLSMIQDYLFYTNLIIYVISSRTGLRQADIKFLSIIKKMGIMDNIIFVINCDFNEHETIEDLNQLIKKVKEELTMFLNKPEVYSFSALLNLFKLINKNPLSRDTLTKKEFAKLNQWQEDQEFDSFSSKGSESFESSFKNNLITGRYALLVKNHFERLGLVAASIKNDVCINQEIFSQNSLSAQKMIDRLKENQVKMNRIKDLIKNTLSGTVQRLKQEIKLEIDKFFRHRAGNVVGDLIEFIRKYRLAYEKYENNLDTDGFANTLYLVFQDFKMEIDTFTAEKLNPEVLRFIKEKEAYLLAQFEAIAAPYEIMLNDAFVQYINELSDFGIKAIAEKTQPVNLSDFDTIKLTAGLTFPPIVAHMNFSARIKTEAIMHFGFHNFISFIKQIFKKEEQNSRKGMGALKQGAFRIKQEAEKSIISDFVNYQENLKFQYFFQLIESVANSNYKTLIDHFHANSSDHVRFAELIIEKQIDKKQALKCLKKMEQAAENIYLRIKSAKEQLTEHG